MQSVTVFSGDRVAVSLAETLFAQLPQVRVRIESVGDRLVGGQQVASQRHLDVAPLRDGHGVAHRLAVRGEPLLHLARSREIEVRP